MQSEGAAPADGISPGGGYNQVFEFFIDRPAEGVDLAGLIAYSLYKSQKREWLIAYAAQHGRPPSAVETAAMTAAYVNVDARHIYRRQAASLLDGYASTYVDASTAEIREGALNSEMLRQARTIEESLKAKSAFWPSVWSGIVATALWTFLIAILAAALTPDIFKRIFSIATDTP